MSLFTPCVFNFGAWSLFVQVAAFFAPPAVALGLFPMFFNLHGWLALSDRQKFPHFQFFITQTTYTKPLAWLKRIIAFQNPYKTNYTFWE